MLRTSLQHLRQAKNTFNSKIIGIYCLKIHIMYARYLSHNSPYIITNIHSIRDDIIKRTQA